MDWYYTHTCFCTVLMKIKTGWCIIEIRHRYAKNSMIYNTRNASEISLWSISKMNFCILPDFCILPYLPVLRAVTLAEVIQTKSEMLKMITSGLCSYHPCWVSPNYYQGSWRTSTKTLWHSLILAEIVISLNTDSQRQTDRQRSTCQLSNYQG